MYSTMLIPKCSSTIVFSPMLASPSSSKMREYGAFTTNSTYSCAVRLHAQLAPSSRNAILWTAAYRDLERVRQLFQFVDACSVPLVAHSSDEEQAHRLAVFRITRQ
jgi:hypothetical protein